MRPAISRPPASRAVPRGGELTVTLGHLRIQPPADHGGPQADHVFVSVRDQGVGIDSSILPRVFEPFFTTKEVGAGTGLGLSVSRGIVHEHGGWLSVSSDPGHGAVFTMWLPGHARNRSASEQMEEDRSMMNPASGAAEEQASPLLDEGVKVC